MTIIENTLSVLLVPLAAAVTGKAGNMIAQAVVMPDWIDKMMGPLSALFGTLVAIKWLLARLDKAEQKMDFRDVERDKTLTLMAQMTVQNQIIIQQNSDLLTEVKSIIQDK